ncbi:MAG: hypothetical protein IPM69_17510 [Ignavibacteria bacterium]|nr:hypothetical protein [Ignavibacteria bacterium]
MKVIIFVLLVTLSAVISSAQIRLDNWKTHTSMYTVRSATLDGKGNVWAATSGGVFRYNDSTKETIQYRNIDALLSLNTTVINYNPVNKSIYVGADDGVIEVIDSQLQFRHITDIRNQTTLSRRRINDFLFLEDKIYVAGDFGIIDYNFDDAPGDDIRQLGTFQQNTPVLKLATLNDTLWAITPLGLACAPLSAPSLRNSQVWRNFTVVDGLLENSCVGLCVLKGKLYIAHQSGVVRYENGTFTSILSGLTSISTIVSMQATEDSLYYVDDFTLFSMDENGSRTGIEVNFSNKLTGVSTSKNTVFPFYELNGMGVVTKEKITTIRPNTPYSNLFLSLSIDTRGGLWCATSYLYGGGFTHYSKGKFNNFTTTTYPNIKSNGYFKISSMPDGTTWAGNWGTGIAKIEIDTFVTVYNTFNSALTGISADTNFVLSGEAAADRKGNIWITNYKNTNPGPVIVVKSIEDEWYGYTGSAIDKHSFTSLVVDNSNTKWLGSPDGDGLAFFYEKATLTDQSDDIWGRLTSSNSSLSSNIINALAIDKNGALWIATSEGICVIFAPSGAQRGINPSIQKLSSLSTEVINDITVDALNQKWVATNTGVYILNEDGISALGTINMKNSPLVSDQVKSVAIDDASGIAYLGTSDGLTEVRTLSVRPRDEYAIECFPQPFNPLKDGEMVIEGLAAESSIRILTLDGLLVRAIETKSRKTIWDGRNESGELTQTGVYLVRVSSMLDNTSSVSKIAVVRQ